MDRTIQFHVHQHDVCSSFNPQQHPYLTQTELNLMPTFASHWASLTRTESMSTTTAASTPSPYAAHPNEAHLRNLCVIQSLHPFPTTPYPSSSVNFPINISQPRYQLQ